jgi:nucleotide-binding universal stress UspA family protein
MNAPYRHIGCCLDESEASVRALAEARRLRAVAPGRLTLLHVVQFPLPYSAGFGTQATPNALAEAAHQWLDPMAAEVPEGESVMLQGYPAAEVCEWAHMHAVDLLVCAAHRNLPQRLALGSFAHYLVNHAPCPVLVLRPPGA